MDVIVISDSPDISSCFSDIGKDVNCSTCYLPYKDLRKCIKVLKKNSFIYIDVSGLRQEELEKLFKYLSNHHNRRYGIIDSKGKIKDIGALFLEGASDYIGKETYHKGVSLQRLRKAYKFHPLRTYETKEAGGMSDISEFIIPGDDWRKIKSGREYTFCFMYILLENRARLTRNFSDDQITAADGSFKAYIDRTVAQSGGRIWMWNDFEGLVLFPFDGKRCDAVLICYRLMLSQKIYSVESPYFRNMLSLHIVLHIGNTIYRKAGDTGTIVSDSINTVFNLGRKFGDHGNFYLTKQVLDFAHEGLRGCFVPAGHYNGTEIMKMRLLRS
jgi:hypothetical protein